MTNEERIEFWKNASPELLQEVLENADKARKWYAKQAEWANNRSTKIFNATANHANEFNHYYEQIKEIIRSKQ